MKLNLDLNIEVWKSNTALEERHYFLADERNTYLFGYNPKIISEKKAKKILEIIGSNTKNHV